jgi:hypothetical protein
LFIERSSSLYRPPGRRDVSRNGAKSESEKSIRKKAW